MSLSTTEAIAPEKLNKTVLNLEFILIFFKVDYEQVNG